MRKATWQVLQVKGWEEPFCAGGVCVRVAMLGEGGEECGSVATGAL